MGLNFPDIPGIGSVHFTGGFFYRWDGTKWISYHEGTSRDIKKLDNIAPLFDGSRTTFPLTTNGLTAAAGGAEKYLIVVGGIQQSAYADYETSLNSPAEITFFTPPESNLTFQGVSLTASSPNREADGGLNILDGSVTPIKLSTGGPGWSGVGTVYAQTFSGRGDRLTGVSSQFNAGVRIASAGVAIGIATQLNFIGAGNTFAFRSNALGDTTIDISIAGGGGGGGDASADITGSLFF